MIKSKYLFRTEEAVLTMPQQGIQTYLIESTYPINYANHITCSTKKTVSIKIQPDEDQPSHRFIVIQVLNNNFKFSDGSRAMQDILKKVASVFLLLKLKVSSKGEILSVINIEDLQITWKEIKELITIKYKGNQVECFIEKTETMFHSEEELIKEVELYHNFGGLMKSIYKQYNSDAFEIISQQLATKYGNITVKEEVLLQSQKESGDVQLQLQAHHPENKEYVSINGTYTFTGQNESWLKQAVISCIEKYGRQEYHSKTHIIKKS